MTNKLFLVFCCIFSMNREEMNKVESYFEAFLIISLILVFIYLIKSFLVSLLFASTLVFLTYEFYLKILKKVKNENFSALIVLIVVLIIIILPFYLITAELVKQTTVLVTNSNGFVHNIDFEFCSENKICNMLEENIRSLDFSFDALIVKYGTHFQTTATALVGSVSKIAVNLFVFILAFFFLLKDGEKFTRYIKRVIPMKNEYKHALFMKFRDVSSAVFVNVLLIAFIQGGLVGLGFWFFQIPSPLFWGVIATFFALIPVIGAAIVWIPAVIYLLLIKSYFFAIALGIYGTVVVGLSDNLLRPQMLKNKIEVHPFLILLSILGAIEVFGFLGVFLGPIIISLLVSVLHLYNLNFK